MGVKGLTTSVSSKKSLVKSSDVFNLTKLATSGSLCLVIDTSSLVYHIYLESGLDWVNGGEYDLYAKFLHEYLVAFSENNITLYFVFDGIDNDSKMDTKIERQNANIEENARIALMYPNTVVGSKKLRIPQLTRQVTLNVLRQYKNVVCVQAPSEADAYIASLAVQKDAFGVVTSDSDFMILDTQGFIPCDSIKITRKEDSLAEILVSKKSPKSIATTLQVPCENGSEKFLLPLVACLLGNDYISPSELKPFHDLICAKYRKFTVKEKKGSKPVKKVNNVANVVSFIREYHYSKDSKTQKKAKSRKDEGHISGFFREAFTEAFTPSLKRRGGDSDEVLKQKLESLIVKATNAHSMYVINEFTHPSVSFDQLFEKKIVKEVSVSTEDKEEKERKKKVIKKVKQVSGAEVLMDTTLSEDVQEIIVEEADRVVFVEKKKEEVDVEVNIQHEVIEDEKPKEEVVEEAPVEEKKETKVALAPLKTLKGFSTFLSHFYKNKEEIIEQFKSGEISEDLIQILHFHHHVTSVPIEKNELACFNLWTPLRQRLFSAFAYAFDFQDEEVVIREYFSAEGKYDAHDMSLSKDFFKSEGLDKVKFEASKQTWLALWKYVPSTETKDILVPLVAVLRQFALLKKKEIKPWEFDCLLATLCSKDVEGASKLENLGEKGGEKRNKMFSIDLNVIAAQFQSGLILAQYTNAALGQPFKDFAELYYLFSGFRFQTYYAKAAAFMKDKTEYNIGALMTQLQIPTPNKNRIAALRKEIFRELK